MPDDAKTFKPSDPRPLNAAISKKVRGDGLYVDTENLMLVSFMDAVRIPRESLGVDNLFAMMIRGEVKEGGEPVSLVFVTDHENLSFLVTRILVQSADSPLEMKAFMEELTQRLLVQQAESQPN